MLTEDFALSLNANVSQAQGNREGMSFESWLVLQKGFKPRDAGRFESYIGKMLLDNNTPFPTREDANKIAIRLMNSDKSLSYKKHLLSCLEAYMQYTGTEGVSFKKPRPAKRSPKYLSEEQLGKLVKTAENYRDFALITPFCTTGMRLGELCQLNVQDVALQR